MNTNGLAKHYNTLTPRERLPLIMAARLRNDEEEARRLIDTAPRSHWSMPDYSGMAEGLQHLEFFHLLELLDLAVILTRCMEMADRREIWAQVRFWEDYVRVLSPRRLKKSKGEDDNGTESILATLNGLDEVARVLAYRFVSEIDGWKTFCAELNLDPVASLKFLPGQETIAGTEERARAIAFTADEALACLRKHNEDEDSAFPTVAELAKSWHVGLDWWMDKH